MGFSSKPALVAVLISAVLLCQVRARGTPSLSPWDAATLSVQSANTYIVARTFLSTRLLARWASAGRLGLCAARQR